MQGAPAKDLDATDRTGDTLKDRSTWNTSHGVTGADGGTNW